MNWEVWGEEKHAKRDDEGHFLTGGGKWVGASSLGECEIGVAFVRFVLTGEGVPPLSLL